MLSIILAGGTGSRFGADRPKQFLDLGGRMVIERSIDAFDQHAGVGEVAVVVHPDWIDFMADVVARNHWQKVTRIIPGGSERYMSSLHAIQAYEHQTQWRNIILHDAARPWVSHDVISRVVAALGEHEAVGVGIPSTDTIWQLDGDGVCIQSVPERARMFRAQTPQAFRLDIIAEAYRRALSDPHMQATDDCGVVLRYMPEVPIHIVVGEEQNRKITFQADI